MKELTNVSEKQQISEKIRSLVNEINQEIKKANDLRLYVRIMQNPPISYLKNSDVNVSIHETVSY